MRDLRPLLAPTSIAIVAASSRPHTVASRPLTNLQQVGYSGDIYLINPNSPEIAGVRCYPKLDELPGVPEALVTIDATTDLIVVKGTKPALSANPQCEEIFTARLFGEFSCHFAAPPGMTICDIDQRFENGVLHLKIGVLPGDPPGA